MPDLDAAVSNINAAIADLSGDVSRRGAENAGNISHEDAKGMEKKQSVE
jgi:hypothetical protein